MFNTMSNDVDAMSPAELMFNSIPFCLYSAINSGHCHKASLQKSAYTI